ncbi:GDSL esterase/lipase At4g16230 isoform X2 [Cannabis sativa]|uniref:GDSL esterase/lipase At4g16230 isoform X2 n=1 Tax=Cannabis sativa TaxID=3483 RepID=UPI0029C9B5FD|nr:GDSL esterase/lipase At4g16230 isoform X2 [Cannabis sativa]
MIYNTPLVIYYIHHQDIQNTYLLLFSMAIYSSNCSKLYIVTLILFMMMISLFGICLGQNSSVGPSFIFGDALFDAGNNNFIPTLSKSDFYPYGIDFGQPTGRFTNGKTVIDILGEELGYKDFTLPYLSPLLAITDDKLLEPRVLDLGVNYASAGAGILNETGKIFRLYNLGARKIVVLNVGPIGCTPSQRDANILSLDNNNCAIFPNRLAQIFNMQLRNLITELTNSLEGSKLVYADVYNVMEDIIENYSKYGFENSDSSCCYVVGRFGGLIPCGPKSKVCLERNKHVFWDPYNPSQAANEIIAKSLLDGDTHIISPNNVRQLFQS